MGETNTRVKNIDLLKGILIILVITGHVIQGGLDESIWRTLIYSFHMPLFIGITGYLLNIDKISKLNLRGRFKKYLFRIILPWSIAIISYYVISCITRTNLFSVTKFKNFILHPLYHLWFIPGFLSWILLTWLLKKFFTNFNIILLLGFLLSIVFLILYKYPFLYTKIPFLNEILSNIIHTFRPYFILFFLIGISYRNKIAEKPRLIEIVAPVISLGLVIYLFYNYNAILSILNFFILNLLILNLSLKLATTNSLFESKSIQWLGTNSLGIYLWHFLPILISKYLIGTESLFKFYLLTIILEIIFIISYKILIKVNFFKKYIFGM
ncbi:acyltransferase [Flavobacterium zhairuonense]|uniref:acyltransferase family protein n=1 Tax=Flavobacterium zhairuonense TaxID=2493631 RepID=UPI0013C31237|nr:acyltransferase [Flavobacterium zhairuonense]